MNMHLNIILLLNMGLAAGKMEPFIVGGHYTDIKQFPHSIYLYIYCINAYMCGGSILTSHIVLTAGHCLYECKQKRDYDIRIKFGDASVNKMKTLIVSDFFVHNQYKDDHEDYDIALVYTRKSLPLGEVLKRVAIVRRYPARATGGYVTGWGVIDSLGKTTPNIKYIYQELQDPKMCLEVLNIPPGAFCARPNTRHQHPDHGDSGGGLVVNKFIQIGIVSFKNVNYDLVAYTNVTYYYRWIKHNALKLACGNVS